MRRAGGDVTVLRGCNLNYAALKKMSSGEKLSFDEMKLIFGDSNNPD